MVELGPVQDTPRFYKEHKARENQQITDDMEGTKMGIALPSQDRLYEVPSIMREPIHFWEAVAEPTGKEKDS